MADRQKPNVRKRRALKPCCKSIRGCVIADGFELKNYKDETLSIGDNATLTVFKLQLILG
jgi:hypothetical protein